MLKILATSVIITLTTFYPVCAMMLNGKKAEQVLANGQIINSHFDSNITMWRILVKYEEDIFNCVSYYNTDTVENICYDKY